MVRTIARWTLVIRQLIGPLSFLIGDFVQHTLWHRVFLILTTGDNGGT